MIDATNNVGADIKPSNPYKNILETQDFFDTQVRVEVFTSPIQKLHFSPLIFKHTPRVL